MMHHGFSCEFDPAGPTVRWADDTLEVTATRGGVTIKGSTPALTAVRMDRTLNLLAFASAVADYLAGLGARGSVEPMLERLKQRADPASVHQPTPSGDTPNA